MSDLDRLKKLANINEGTDFKSSFVDVGKANELGITEQDVDSRELEMGIDVEYEHTTDPNIAKRIALDHLAEIPDYYTRLAKMEAEGKAAKE